MNTDQAVAWLRDHGYTVTPMVEFDFPAWQVEGHGVYSEYHEDTIIALADEEAHAERAQQVNETTEETRDRHIAEGKIEEPPA